MRFIRADAAFTIPGLYETLEAESYFYAIWMHANRILQGRIAHLPKRLVERPPNRVRRIYGDFEYPAAGWDKPRPVVAKVEWRPGELFPMLASSSLTCRWTQTGSSTFTISVEPPSSTFREGKQAINWTRLSCKDMAQNEIRLQLQALA